MKKLKLRKNHIAIAAVAFALVAAAIMSGLTAARVLAGMLLLFFLPAYLILRNFLFDEDETIFLSFFLGLAIFPIVAYHLNRIVPSLRLSVALTFLIGTAVGVLLSLRKRKAKTTD